MCSYEVDLFNGTLATGLCSLFDVEGRRILDFWSDLKNYCKQSAGHKITYESSCALLRDFYNTIKEVRDKPGEHYNGVSDQRIRRPSYSCMLYCEFSWTTCQ